MTNPIDQTTDKRCIAIIGMSGRFPGAGNVDAFWSNLRNGVESVSFFSDRELEASGIDPAILSNPNYVKAGAVLEDVGRFDAEFFGFTAREAECLDPQHRLLLECAWEAIEHAGYASGATHGTIGVYAGSRISEYLLCNLPIPDMVGFNLESGPLVTNWKRVLDNDKDTLAARIAYKLNLRGPAVAIQTACSTSLVALHMACQSLFREECDIILAGGVCVRIPQKAGYLYSEGMLFSPDGHTRAFDAKGAGTIFSSGAGMVALKRLDKALADGDCIHAVIRGSAINNDGNAMKAAFTAPSADGQADVISKALAAAKMDPGSISYVEAHGTATIPGDLAEISALSKAFRSGTSKTGFCALGSVKTNIGHPTQAAGIIGLIKTVLMLKHKMLVPHLHFEKPNPQIDFEKSPFYVNTALTQWKTEGRPRRAGINSFGVGGTNVHVILEEAPPVTPAMTAMQRPDHILCLSAKNSAALEQLRTGFETFFRTHPDASVADVCYTANAGRTHFSRRIAVVADSSAAMRKRLSVLSSNGVMNGCPRSPAVDAVQPKSAFLFSGQGAQYIDMGRQLFETQPCFRKAMMQCDKLLRPYLPHPLLAVLYPEQETRADFQKAERVGKISSRLDETLYTQTSLFALEYSLVALWKSWGVKPDVVMGHSIGEYVAACVAGVFDLEDALRLVAERGRLMQDLAGNGAMASVFADEKTLEQFIPRDSDCIAIAAVNGPEHMVVSGRQNAVRILLEKLKQAGIKGQLLNVSHAFHSPLVEPVMDTFEQIAAKVKFRAPTITIVSNVTGKRVEGLEMSCAGYWRRHLRKPVRFARSMATLVQLGCNTFIEAGPGSTLLGMGRSCVKDGGDWLPTLRKGAKDWPQMLKSLAALYEKGINVDWAGFDQDYPRRRFALPTYPFQRQHYWIDRKKKEGPSPDKLPSRSKDSSESHHPLLGKRLPSALSEIQFESRLYAGSTPFLRDHRAFGAVILPATAFIEMAMAAASAISLENGSFSIEELVILEALTLADDQNVIVQFILTPEETEDYSFRIFSIPQEHIETNAQWTCHVIGKLHGSGPADLSSAQPSLKSIRARDFRELSVSRFYAESQTHGVVHGPGFQAVEKLWQGKGEALARIRLPKALTENDGAYGVHPVLLDACVHSSKAAFPGYDQDTENNEIFLPTIFERITICEKIEGPLWCYAAFGPSDHTGGEIRKIDFIVFNAHGNAAAHIQGLHLKRATRQSLLKRSDTFIDNWLYEIKWQAKPLVVAGHGLGEPAGKWLVFTDGEAVGSELARHLSESGETCISVFPGAFSIQLEKNACSVNPEHPEDFQKLFAQVRRLPGVLRGVVHLWGLKNAFEQKTDIASLMDTQVLDCASGLHLIQALAAETEEAPRLWIVTRAAQALRPEDSPLAVAHSPLWGLGRVAAREHPQLGCIMIDLDPAIEPNEISMLHDELRFPDGENQIGFRQQVRQVARLVRVGSDNRNSTKLSVPDVPCFRLESAPSGILNHLSFRKRKRCKPGPGEIEIAVRATGLNFRDVLCALGKYPGDPGPLGRECSGIVSAVGDGVDRLSVGDEVLAMAPGAFGNHVITNALFAVPKPCFLSFEDAASIPIVFLTAYYGLFHLSRLRAGEKVLIHAASGGVGLAASQLVEWAGAQLLATASHGKWAFLKSRGISHIMDSRSLDFTHDVMALTDGRGVDIVLNSLAGDFIPASLSVLKDKGRFIEIGKSGIWDAGQVNQFRPDVAYHPFDLGDVARKDPVFFQSIFQKLMTGFLEGPLKPLPQKRFPIQDAIRAFRYMAQAKHIGKIVVYQNSGGGQPDQKDSGVLRSDSTFLITGGLGALGLRIAKWMVAQNARHLVLVGRTAPSRENKRMIRQLEDSGARVHVAQVDVSDPNALSTVLDRINNDMPPLRGIIHAAGVLDDGVLRQQNWGRFVKVMLPKVKGAWNLHTQTQHLPLDFFILFSSVSSFWGTPGQGNYAAANAFLDGLAHLRRGKRLACVSVNWGSWAEVGMAAVLEDKIKKRKRTKGLGTIDLDSGLDILGRLICGDSGQTAVFNMNWAEYLKQFPAGLAPPLFSEMVKENARHTANNSRRPAKQTGILQQIENAPEREHEKILSAFVRQQAALIIGLDSGESWDAQASLFEFGLDSLSAIELRNAFESSIGCALPATMLYDYQTFDALCKYLGQKIATQKEIPDTGSDLLHNSNAVDIIGTEADGPPSVKNMPPAEQTQIGNPPYKDHLPMISVHTSGNRPPLFFVHGRPLNLHRWLGPDQPLYHFKSYFGIRGKLPARICIEDIASAHIKEIKAVQPVGPYFLGGYSVGGLLAYEMAQQLIGLGDKIAFLFLLEPTTPAAFCSEEGTQIRFDQPQKLKRRSLNQKIQYKANIGIAKLINGAFQIHHVLTNSHRLLPSMYQGIFHKLRRSRFFSQVPAGGHPAQKAPMAVINPKSLLRHSAMTTQIMQLYEQAKNDYLADTYPGRILICKVKQGSSVNESAWAQLAGEGTQIKELDLIGHLAPIDQKNTSEWMRWMKHDLDKAQAN